ncbi:hypothetical protein ACOI9X_22230 [Pseudomonas sp. P2757]|uniref:hypothetical protein n=1 Tax=unclassified Pseudomonas TaxID=196821 RepID=UPI003B5AFB9C
MVHQHRNLPLQALALMASVGVCGCVPPPLVSYRPSDPPVVTLPLVAAGVRDERSVFATRFAAELAASSAPDDRDVAKWIHWPTVPTPPPAPSSPLHDVSILVIPGIFGDCVADQALPFSDGVVRTPAKSFTEGYAYLTLSGFTRVQAVNVHGRASSSTNGEIIAAAILREANDPTITRILVVGYSKGVADTLHALAKIGNGRPLRTPLSFISVSGVVMGTPLADKHDDLYKQLGTRYSGLNCTPSDGQEVTSLTRHQRLRWLEKHPRMPGVNLYSIVAYAGASSISPGLLAFYQLLAQVDPRNDGQMIASDAVLPNSTLLAEANSDHWTYVLPLRNHPAWTIRSATSDLPYPRAEFFRALIRTVIELDTFEE